MKEREREREREKRTLGCGHWPVVQFPLQGNPIQTHCGKRGKHICTHVCMYACMCAWMCVCMCMYVCMYAWMCKSVNMYGGTSTWIHTWMCVFVYESECESVCMNTVREGNSGDKEKEGVERS